MSLRLVVRSVWIADNTLNVDSESLVASIGFVATMSAEFITRSME